jgi:hypothetical protein
MIRAFLRRWLGIDRDLHEQRARTAVLMDRVDGLELAEADRQHREAGRAVALRPEVSANERAKKSS